MAARTDIFDLERLRLSPGQGRRLDLDVRLDDFSFAGQEYGVAPRDVAVRLDVARMTGSGYSLRLRFEADLTGPCMRCLGAAQPSFAVDAREVDQPGGGDELDSPYVNEAEELDVRGWARDALALALPAQIVCRDECAGLCPECGRNLNDEPHEHERAPDPRWSKLRELKLDG
ncbi:MAG TPA: YceD family protein [Solirubrobacteraceae bacterium]|nr:YceD family protein [Solirubrobacteraceae bacterium]